MIKQSNRTYKLVREFSNVAGYKMDIEKNNWVLDTYIKYDFKEELYL